MNEENTDDIGAAAPPEWLLETLNAARASHEFERRCKEAGAFALNLARMRDANRRRDFEEASLAERISALADGLGIALDPILRWFGLTGPSLSDPDEALARFGLVLDFDKGDLVAYLGIGECHSRGWPVAPLPRGQVSQATLRERCLESVRGVPDPELRVRLRALRAVVDDEYSKLDS